MTLGQIVLGLVEGYFGTACAVLRSRYAALTHPAAREIVGWLDGLYGVSEEMVQTP